MTQPTPSKKEILAQQFVAVFARLGIKDGQYVWRPRQCEMLVFIGGKIRSIRISAGMTRVEIAEATGRLTGWVEAFANG